MTNTRILTFFLILFITFSSIIPGYHKVEQDLSSLSQQNPMFRLGLQAIEEYSDLYQNIHLTQWTQWEILEVRYRLAGGIYYQIYFSCTSGTYRSQVFVIIWQQTAEVNYLERIGGPANIQPMKQMNQTMDNINENKSQELENQTVDKIKVQNNQTNQTIQDQENQTQYIQIQQQQSSETKMQHKNNIFPEFILSLDYKPHHRRLFQHKNPQNQKGKKFQINNFQLKSITNLQVQQ